MAISEKPPSPPREMTKEEKKVWNAIIKVLSDKGLLSKTDFLMIDVICHTYVEWVNYSQELERFKAENNGSCVQTSPNGYQQPHQLVYLVEKRADMLVKYLGELGMTMNAIAKITKEKKSTEGKVVDPFEDFIKEHPDGP